MKPAWLPNDGECPIWPHHQDTASDMLAEFCDSHLTRKLNFNDLRASFATECYERGLTPSQESRIVGHGVAVAEKHYLDYEAKEARPKLPPDPLAGTGNDDGAEPAARMA